ncbi:MAG: META domain-containing protein, partial [Lentisphaeria bacterium]|nr:META domain-containing protein [Lentisphaeria bacterium]
IIIIIVLACGCQTRNNSLVGAWVLKNSTVKTPPTLYVAKNGSFYGNGGVNRYFGKLALPFEDGKFQINGTPGVTMMFGPDLDKEQQFLKDLTSADRWQINKNGELQLLKGDKVLAVFYAKVITSNEYAKLLKPEEKD